MPTPPGPCKTKLLEVLRWRPRISERELFLVEVLFGLGEVVWVFMRSVDVEERGMSREAEGVVASENASDFRLAGGKKPRVLRGIRPISVGMVSFGRRTQESCFQGGSVSAFECDRVRASGLCAISCCGDVNPLSDTSPSRVLFDKST